MWREVAIVLLSLVTYSKCYEPGLLLTNATHILFKPYDRASSFRPDPEQPRVVHAEPQGRIVGLAVDTEAGYVFWSDISQLKRGIYRATLLQWGNITDVTLLTSDVLEVNGLALDWTTRLLFWTDARRRTIEASDYQGTTRTLSIEGLLSPRGVAVDPIGGWLYWNDQGARRIERSRLDGSGRETIIGSGLHWPNQMVLANNKLYWVDAWNKTVMISSPDGRNPDSLVNLGAAVGDNPLFGLAVPDSKTALVSVWNQGEVLHVNLSTTAVAPFISNLGKDSVFSVAYVEDGYQRKGDHPCGSSRGLGCSHLCLPTGRLSGRCACPSTGGFVMGGDQKTCVAPTDVVLYALADAGEVGFFSPDMDPALTDRYTVGRSLRPVAVTYDPVEQRVYWSDVQERTVHRAKLDGTQHEVFLNYNHSLGIVDGLAVDYKQRRLYYTNMGQVVTGGVSFSWHKIEMINLDGTHRRTLYNLVDRPRAVNLDLERGHVYVTDWGGNAAVLRMNLDGSDVITVANQLQNPNGVHLQGDTVYVVDSKAKTREGKDPIIARLYSIPRGGNETSVVRGVRLGTPFGVTGSQNALFLSDWDKNGAILRVTELETHSPLIEKVMQDTGAPMGLFYSRVSMPPDQSDGACASAACADICVAQAEEKDGATCVCDSYTPEALQSDGFSCQVPESFVLVADMTSIKLRSLHDEAGDGATYTLVQGGGYFSNYAGLAFDPVAKHVFFSDVNRRAIYYVSLDGSESGLLYSPSHIIDSMLYEVASATLWWTDYLSGSICSLDVSDVTSRATRHVVWIQGRSKPRALAVDSDKQVLYWTEWGRSPSVQRMFVGDHPVGDPETMRPVLGPSVSGAPSLARPNGLHLDQKAQELYVADGELNQVIRCKLQGNNNDADCEVLTYVTNVPRHVFSLDKVKDILIYSDWLSGSISAISMTSGQPLDDVMQGLMRPSQFYVQLKDQPECGADHGCSDVCVVTLMSYQCACDVGRVLQEGAKNCTNSSHTWEERPGACSNCSAQQTCARRVGELDFACECKPGYAKEGDGCTACAQNRFKPEAGPDACDLCPGSSFAVVTGSRSCTCGEGLTWNWKSLSCTGFKPGSCPSRVSKEHVAGCNNTCQSDADCSRGRGAQKCCSLKEQCPDSKQCVDPVETEECVYMGTPHYLSESFKPNECTTCKCEHEKYYGWEKFGGAKCTVYVCPPTPCDKEHQIHKPGACCPSCPEYQFNKVLEFTNCPQKNVTLTLDSTRPYVVYDPKLTLRDHSGINREVNVTRTPNVTWFWWVGRDVVQKMAVILTSRSPEGHIDKDVCQINIIVKDENKPVMQCQGDTVLYTRDNQVTAHWLPPVVTDNNGVPHSANCSLEWGSQLALGKHNVRYTVEDSAGNLEGCSFTITVVREDIPCGSPITPFRGSLDCGRVDAWACRLTCSAGYQVNPAQGTPVIRSCKGKHWSPEYKPNYQSQACVRVKPPVWRLQAQLQLNFFSESTSPTELLVSFKDTITSRYLNKTEYALGVSAREAGIQGLVRRRRRNATPELASQRRRDANADKPHVPDPGTRRRRDADSPEDENLPYVPDSGNRRRRDNRFDAIALEDVTQEILFQRQRRSAFVHDDVMRRSMVQSIIVGQDANIGGWMAAQGPRRRWKRAESEILTVQFELFGILENGTSASGVQAELESVLAQMQRDTAEGNLSFPGIREQIVPLEGSIRTTRSTWMGCGFGQQQVKDQCVLCPVGSYLDLDSGNCTQCGEGTFQDQEGQETCEECEVGLTSETGAFMHELCFDPAARRGASGSGDGAVIAGAVIGATLVVVFIILIVVGVLLCKGRKTVKGKRMPGSPDIQMNYSNDAFENDGASVSGPGDGFYENGGVSNIELPDKELPDKELYA